MCVCVCKTVYHGGYQEGYQPSCELKNETPKKHVIGTMV